MNKSTAKIIAFFRRNAIYCILAFCIFAVGLSVALMLVNRPDVQDQFANQGGQITDDPLDVEKPDDPQEPNDSVAQVVTFIMPVDDVIEVGDYCESVAFNQTLGVYTAHRAVDFYATEGSEVYAVYDGVVESIENSILHGVTICINHGNGLKTYYNSIMDGDSVVVNQKVSQGDVIGEVSVTNRQEYKSGAHLHFAVTQDGQFIDPSTYLTFEEK